MALKSVIAKLEDAAENVRSLYRAGTADEKADGKFILDVEPSEGFTLENVDGLKNALSAERTETGRLKAVNKAFDGIDPEKARTAIAKVDELGTLDPKKDMDRLVEEKVQAQLTQVNERHAGETAKLQKRLDGRDGLLRTTLVQEAAVKAIAAEGGDPDLLLPHVLPSIQLELEEDEATGRVTPKTKVVGPDGNVRIGDSQGNPMSIAQRVGEMKTHDKFSRLFEGSGHTGSGSEPPARKPGSNGTKPIGQLSRHDRSKLVGEIGLPAFQERLRNESQATANAE